MIGDPRQFEAIGNRLGFRAVEETPRKLLLRWHGARFPAFLCLGIALLLLVMNYNHPYTREARFYFATTPIIPVVRGPVTEVPVQPNVPVKKGDVLFRIDARPYEFVVQQKQAALAEAEQNVLQLKASLEASLADVNEAAAARGPEHGAVGADERHVGLAVARVDR